VLDTNPGATIIAGDPRLSVEPVTRYGEPYGPANNRVTVHLVGEQPSRTDGVVVVVTADCRGRRSSGRVVVVPPLTVVVVHHRASRLRRGRRRRTNLVTNPYQRHHSARSVAERETSSVAESHHRWRYIRIRSPCSSRPVRLALKEDSPSLQRAAKAQPAPHDPPTVAGDFFLDLLDHNYPPM